MSSSAIDLAYLVAAILFVLGVRRLSHPRTAVQGNALGALGMLIAVVATLFSREIVGFGVIAAGLVTGSLIGAVLAVRIKMTAMPQLVAVFNGFGGAASALVAGASLPESAGFEPVLGLSTAASGIIGAVTLTGSLIAFGKLQELLPGNPIRLPAHSLVNAASIVGTLALAAWVTSDPASAVAFWSMTLVASLFGVLLVLPVGGADMPVVIALLNSFSGLAAAAVGFVLDNNSLIISGSLVGAAGFILTQIMCRAMNRSLTHVMLGRLQEASGGIAADEVYAGRVKSTAPEEVALLLDGARRVVIVPGYGLAVAQAQYAVRDLVELLEGRGLEVEFAIHPVAGRMPGHMNVLLAEANIAYEKLREMEDANRSFEQTDLVLVLGANDVVNPLAIDDPTSPIAGMPILEAFRARTVVVVKRSLSPGFAGIPNPLFANDNTLMLFGDAEKRIAELIAALKESD